MKKLKFWLRFNAVFSTVCAIILLVDNYQIQQVFGFENSMVLPVLSIGLLPFAGYVYWVSRQHPIMEKHVRSISLMDGVWVLGSIVLIAFQPFGLTMVAYISIAIVALFVGLFGIQQYRNIKT